MRYKTCFRQVNEIHQQVVDNVTGEIIASHPLERSERAVGGDMTLIEVLNSDCYLDRKIHQIKLVRELTSLGLVEAKKLVESWYDRGMLFNERHEMLAASMSPIDLEDPNGSDGVYGQ